MLFEVTVKKISSPSVIGLNQCIVQTCHGTSYVVYI